MQTKGPQTKDFYLQRQDFERRAISMLLCLGANPDLRNPLTGINFYFWIFLINFAEYPFIFTLNYKIRRNGNSLCSQKWSPRLIAPFYKSQCQPRSHGLCWKHNIANSHTLERSEVYWSYSKHFHRWHWFSWLSWRSNISN